MNKNKEISDILTKEEVEELNKRGYRPLRVIGEGNTRYVLEVKYTSPSGDFHKIRVVKIPKNGNEINSGHGISAWAKISMSRGDLNNKELNCAGEINHPNVANLIDSFKLNSKTVNVEEYINGRSLEERVQDWGPIKDNKNFERIFKKVIDGLFYLNEDKGILHRDIKPSNIMVNGKEVKITDLQNASYKKDINDEILPTRGGTACTHPKLLNSVVKNKKTSADDKTEIYALGATMYYALTGKFPFAYNLIYDNNGVEIDSGKEKIKVSLSKNGDRIKEITKEEHEKELKRSLKKVPYQYRKLLHKSLSLNDKFKDYNFYQLKEDFKKSYKSKRQLILEQIKRKGSIALLTALGSGSLAFLFGLGMSSGNKYLKAQPTLQDVLRSKEYEYVNTIPANNIAESMSIKELRPYYKNLEEKLRDHKEEINQALEHTHFIATRHKGVDERLLNALIFSCILENKKNVNELDKKEGKISPYLIPKYFVQAIGNDYSKNSNFPPVYALNDIQEIGLAAKYLTQNYNFNDNVADVYAKYFCSREEIATAMQKTGNSSYFPRIGSATNNNTLSEGYGSYLPPEKQKLINRAIAIYLSMDKSGKLDGKDGKLDLDGKLDKLISQK